jgi:hypothetical protein
MYKPKEHHALSSPALRVPPAIEEAMWNLFLAIGDLWQLTDDPQPYRLRFDAFLENRITLNPLYVKYYEAAEELVVDLAAQKDLDAAYHLLFLNQNPYGLTYSQTLLTAIQQRVTGEFIACRLSLGGFRAWGAINYRSYFGGANLAGEPVPYRPAKGLK